MDLTEISRKIDQEKQDPVLDVKEVAKKVDQKIEQLEIKEFAERIETFNISYQDGKKTRKATLTSKIMDSEARARYDRVLSELSGGLSFDNLPLETKNRYICLARLVGQVVQAPDWVLEKASEDIEFCYAIGGKLVSHEARYFRYYNKEDIEDKGKPRFQID